MVWLMLIGFGLFGLISIDSLFIWLWHTVDSCCSHGGSCCFRVDLCWPHVALSSRPRAALCRSSIEPCQFHADLKWTHADSCRKHIELCWSFVHVCCSRDESACSHGVACWFHVALSRPHVALCRSPIDSCQDHVDVCWSHVVSIRPHVALCRSSADSCQYHVDWCWSHVDLWRQQAPSILELLHEAWVFRQIWTSVWKERCSPERRQHACTNCKMYSKMHWIRRAPQ